METELRPFWNRIFRFDWKFGLFLIFIICIPRFFLVLNANATHNYKFIGIIMVISAIIPFIFLKKHGLRTIGIIKPTYYKWIFIGFIAGLLFCFILYFIGRILYDDSFENWYKYIGYSYTIPPGISTHDKAIIFAITAFTGMIFSPIGEEFFFRGIVHQSFASSIGQRKASIINSSAFALTHISHFGLVYINDHWMFLIIPTIIWVFGMFIVSLLFTYFKRQSGSILGAIFCHAAFNLAMIFCIFYIL